MSIGSTRQLQQHCLICMKFQIASNEDLLIWHTSKFFLKFELEVQVLLHSNFKNIFKTGSTKDFFALFSH